MFLFLHIAPRTSHHHSMNNTKVLSQPIIDWDSVIDDKYCYSVYITEVYDGDTVTCDIDIGFGIIMKKQKIRLYGINAPEMKGNSRDSGIITRDRLRQLVLNNTINLYTIKDTKEKYGRWLGILKILDVNINQLLIDENFVKAQIY